MRAEWKHKRLGEVCDIAIGKTPSRGNKSYWDVDKSTNNVWLSIADLLKTEGDIVSDSKEYISDKGASLCKPVKAGTLLASFKLTLGRLAFAGHDMYTNEAIASLAIKDERELSKNYLYHYLNFFDWDAATAGDVKLKGKTLNKQKLKEMPIFFPASLTEQQRIVTILDQAFDGIATATANAEKNLANARGLFDVHFASLFNSENKNWDRKTLGDVCSLYQGIAINAKTKHALVEKSELPLLRIKDLKNNSVEQYINPNNYPKNALVNEDDIIYTRTGSLGLVFRGRRGVLHNNSFKVVPNDSLSKDYLFLWLQNPVFKSKIMDLALRAAQPDITHAIFKMQDISIPSLTEQDDIVKKLNELAVETQRLENIYKQKLEALEALKKSILHQAFTGQLN